MATKIHIALGFICKPVQHVAQHGQLKSVNKPHYEEDGNAGKESRGYRSKSKDMVLMKNFVKTSCRFFRKQSDIWNNQCYMS